LSVEIDGALASRPYVEMKLDVMRSFGVQVESDEAFRRFYNFRVGRYEGRDYAIEPDASAASYFFALPAILGGEITINNLSRNALQGDVRFVDCLEKMGCRVDWREDRITVARDANKPLRGIDVDMNDIPDVAQTLGVVALFADSPTTIRNVANMRVKETDRLAALTAELRKLGADVDERPDGLSVDPTARALHGASIATYDDHRMAMSFALAGLRIPGVAIENPECVAKTYPNFFEDLEKATEPV
ncbi:MAG: 3-phosphoshikimate 1-carboxyvinyltransferase, partial [Thermoguttaceae bacterium]|nr:3-phosphoshikimate 1-carboxyvinyltransferase [Thermoguttaceae bacterium]